tara:strand:+ start:288 stop:569 length:282 start_codon:yes stop_codon:yes gene_type:complete
MKSNKFSQPSIFYEESHEGLTSGFPFMEIEKDSSIPNVLFVGAVQDTNEVNEQNEIIKEVVMQSYFNSESLKNVLDKETYNKIKQSLGLSLLK